MKISLNSIIGMNQRYQTTSDIAPNGVDELVVKIGAQLGAVEEITPIGQRYKGAIVARVVTCYKHDNSDHLNVCLIDDNGVVADVERNEDGLVQVLTGAPNVHDDMLVVWLPPGSTVPDSVGIGKEPFVLSAREMRGETSYGMLASMRELALGEEHDGILEISDPFGKIHAGQDFAEAFELKNDTVLDIENKMFTHRPDCFGFLGVSRELAGIQGLAFKSPEWYQSDAVISAPATAELPLNVHNEIPSLVPRFMMVVMSDVQVGPSPTFLQIELAKVGLRSINNIVDYTNFFMLETGQPLHAYDYDKVAALSTPGNPSIVVRNPRANEQIKLLNGKMIDPRQAAIMIATDKTLIGVGGVMGGADTEVDDTTTRIILECGSFDMYSVRRTSMEHGLFTDAVTRFNKGQSPLQNRAVLAKIVHEIEQFANGKVASQVFDVTTLQDRQWVHPPVPVSTAFINERLGLELSADTMRQLLENVEFAVEVTADTLIVTAPFWRTDIERREDVVEEIGRLYGFDKLPLELPRRSIEPIERDTELTAKQYIRDRLALAGANEVLTYSFVHGKLLQNCGQDINEAFSLGNALSPDLQYYRLSVMPSLLEKVHANIKAGFDQFTLFEVGKAHGKSEFDEQGLPKELGRVAAVVAVEAKAAAKSFSGAPYYQAKKMAEYLLASPQQEDKISLQRLSDAKLPDSVMFKQLLAPFEPGRSALLFRGDHLAGVVGEFRRPVAKALKLPDFCAGFELFLSNFTKQSAGHDAAYHALSRFPKVTQDISLRIASGTNFGEVYALADATVRYLAGDQLTASVEPLDIYQSVDDSANKHISLRVTVTSYQKTLRDEEVSVILDAIAAAAQEKLSAVRL